MHAIPAAHYLARRKRQNLLLGLLALVALCMLLLGVSVGNGVVRLPLGFSEHELALFVRLRLPRVLMGALVGAGLAMSGTLAQAYCGTRWPLLLRWASPPVRPSVPRWLFYWAGHRNGGWRGTLLYSPH